MAAFTLHTYAQDKIYLVKDNVIVATYGVDEVDYLTFDPAGLIPSEDFVITIEETTPTSVTWTVTPTDADMYYYSAVYTEASLTDRFENSVEKMASTLYNDMGFIAGMAGMDLDTFMKEQVLAKGTRTFADYQLGQSSDYCLVVFGCTPLGEVTTETYTSLKFSTPAVPSTNLTVNFEINCNGSDVTIKGTPSDDTVRYCMTVAKTDEGFDAQEYINTLIWRGQVLGKTQEEIIAANTVTGVVTNRYELEPNTSYTVYAMSVSEDGVVNSDVSQTSFTTQGVLHSDNTFTIDITEVTAKNVTFTVTPTNDDSYSIGWYAVSEAEGLSDEEMAQQFIDTKAMTADFFIRTGTSTYELTNLEPDTEYYLFAYGYKQGEINTAPEKVTFTTGSLSDPSTWTATFGEVRLDGRKAQVNIDVNQEDVLYVWNAVDASGTEEQVKEALTAQYNRYKDQMGLNYVEMNGIYGSKEVTFEGIEEGQSYKFFAVVMNAETGEFETQVFFSEPFSR